MARPYRSPVRPSVTAILAMACGSIGAVLLLSLSWRLLGSFGDMAFAGTAARGLLIGALIAWICRRTGFSWPRAAGSIAALATLLALVGSHYDAHRRDRAERVRDADQLLLIRTGAGSEPDEIRAEHQQTLRSLSFANHLRRHFGFEGQAEDGASALWGPRAGLGLYVIEVLLALLLAAYYPAGTASEPVCARCGRWSEERLLGLAAYGVGPAFLTSIQSDPAAAIELLSEPDTKEHIELALATCPQGHDAAGGVLRVRERFYDRGSRHLIVRHRADVVLDESDQQALSSRLEIWS